MSGYTEQRANPMIESSLRMWREQGALLRFEGTECPNCRKRFYPPRYICPICHSQKVLVFRFSGMGKIANVESNTIPQISLLGYGEQIPRYIATVELDEGPFVLGEIVDVCDEKLLAVNARVSSVLRKGARSVNGSWTHIYKFVLT